MLSVRREAQKNEEGMRSRKPSMGAWANVRGFNCVAVICEGDREEHVCEWENAI